MRVEKKRNRHNEGLLKETTTGTRPILQQRFKEGEDAHGSDIDAITAGLRGL
jgi:hypothetical protein